MKPEFLPLDQLAAAVPAQGRLAVGGLHFTRVPVRLILALLSAKPQSKYHYISWSGGLALELFLEQDAVAEATFCFSSLEIFGLAPRFRKCLETSSFPIQELSALSMIEGLNAEMKGVPYTTLQAPVGSDIFKQSDLCRVDDRYPSGHWATVDAIPVDAMILHAQRADEMGNVEILGATGLEKRLIEAAREIYVTVEEVVSRKSFARNRRGYVIPRNFIKAITELPMASYPTGCPEYSVTDYAALQAMVDHPNLDCPPPTDRRVDFLQRAARLDTFSLPRPKVVESGLQSSPVTESERMIVYLASLYGNDSVCSAGAASPVALISYLLAKRTHAPEILIIGVSGGYIDLPDRPMSLMLADVFDHQQAAAHCGGEDTYQNYYQRGRVDYEVVGSAQVDQHGRTNTVQIRKSSGGLLRLPGQGGMADVANMHRNLVVYFCRQDARNLVEEVDFVSAARGIEDPATREKMGYREGVMQVVTNLGVFQKNLESNRLELLAIFPNVTLDNIQENTGFDVVKHPDFREIAEPSPENIRAIRETIDPWGIRRLETVAGKARAELISALIHVEETYIRMALETKPS